MTGGLAWFREDAAAPPYGRVRFDFEGGGHLAYLNRRMLGRVGLAGDADEFIQAEQLGPDALDPAFDLGGFERALAGRRRDVKSVLMDQSVVAGVGNIYADEILFQARLHPRTPIALLDQHQRAALFAQIKAVLDTAIRYGAGAERLLERLPENYLLPQRDKGGKCPRCGAALATLKSGGRTSYFCPRCQPEH
jgi:formamidopyrimidine-DNA glycosylase